MYEYKCVLDRVVDGDTVDAWVDLGFKLKMHKRIRLMGIDAWESRTRDLEEKVKGIRAGQWLHEQLIADQIGEFVVRTEKDTTGKYGRLLGTLFVARDDGSLRNLNEEMITNGHAVPYGEK